MTWTVFFLNLVGPIVGRVMAFMGLASVSIVGLTAVLSGLKTLLVDAWGGLPADILGLAGVAGANVAAGTIVGAYVFRVVLWVKLKAVQFMTKSS